MTRRDFLTTLIKAGVAAAVAAAMPTPQIGERARRLSPRGRGATRLWSRSPLPIHPLHDDLVMAWRYLTETTQP